MRPHGHANVNARHPQAFGCCNRCNFIYNRVDLGTQYEWGGRSLVSTGLWVCEMCMDDPNPQLRAIILPPDPVPVYMPQIDRNLLSIDDTRVTEDGAQRVTEDDEIRAMEGNPP